MKIIYLHQYFTTPEMSGGTRSYEMARRMVDAGHEVHMITSSRDDKCQNNSWFTSTEAGIYVHWCSVPYDNSMSYLKRINAFFAFAFAARKKAASLQGDVVFATSTPLTIAFPAVFTARKLKVPMVFEVRDLWPEMPIAMGILRNPMLQWIAKKLEYWAYFNSAAIVTLSPDMKKGVLQTGYPSDQIAVIPNSCDNNEFEYDTNLAQKFRDKRQWLMDKPLLVYAGTFGKVNGVSYMVNLAKELQNLNSEIKILLVGEGAEKDIVINEAKNEGVYGKNIFFEASIPKKDVPALLSAATMASSLFIDLPEMRANSANKFFDTLASSKPVFINYGGWMHDLIKKHSNGISAWQQPIELVAKELNEKMNNNEWLKQSGKKSRQLAEQEFDREKLANQLISVLKFSIIDESSNASATAPGNY
ncbi:MAG: glycosyltransferase involved in cell wall biosynthesis [Marivirga sp.]|jgi:glycosyltransferase involved in cell wall biosynthesis